MNNEKVVPIPEKFGLPAGNDVYIRTVAADDLEEGIQAPQGVETLYALHDGTGRRLALFDNRDFAFMVARQNDLNAVSAH